MSYLYIMSKYVFSMYKRSDYNALHVLQQSDRVVSLLFVMNICLGYLCTKIMKGHLHHHDMCAGNLCV